MALETAVHEVQLGSSGLVLKADSMMLQPGMLSQADNVIYSSDGALRKRFGTLAVTDIGTAAASLAPTAMFITSDGNLGYVNGNSGGRTAKGQTSGSAVGAPTLQPTFGRTLQVPLYKSATGALYPPSNIVTANNYVLRTGTSTTVDTQTVMAWDYDVDPYGGAATHKRVTYYAVWNVTQTHWDVVPTLLALPATAAFASGTVTVVGAGQPNIFAQNNSSSLTFGSSVAIMVSMQGTLTGNSYTQLGTFVFDTLLGTVTTSLQMYANTQQGPLASGIFTLPSVATLPDIAVSVNPTIFVFAWSPMAATGNGIIGSIDAAGGSIGTPRTQAALGGTIGNARPVVIAWQSTAHTLALIADSTQSTIWNITTFAQSVAATANSMGGGTGSLVAGVGPAPAATAFVLAQAQSDGTHKVGTSNKTTLAIGVVNTIAQYKGATQWRFATQIVFSPGVANNITAQPTAWIAYSGNVAGSAQKTLLLINVNTGRVLGRAAYLAANINVPITPPGVIGYVPGSQGGAAHTFAFLSNGQLVADGLGNFISTPQITMLQTTWGATQAQELPPMGTLTNGLAPAYLTECDGYSLGFSYAPDLPSAGSFTQTNIGNVTGVVQYIAVYRFIDCYNNVHWSAPSAAVTVTISTASTTAIVTLPALPAPDHGELVWFRTAAGLSTFYQLATAPAATAITDNIADATLTGGNVFLYTTGGEVANDPPPSANLICVSGQRAYAVSTEFPWLLYYSKSFRQGHPVEWSALQFLSVAPQTGAITALATMDDKLIIFKANTVLLLSGDGPSLTLAGSFYGPTSIAAFGGCTFPNSLVTTDQGIYYTDVQGIQLLQRNLQSVYVGLPLDGFVGSVTAAMGNSAAGIVRLLDATNNCVWLYDTTVSRWARHTYPSGGVSLMAGNTNIAWFYSATFGFLLESSTVNGDFVTPGVSGVNLQPQATTGDVPIAGMRQAWGRLRRIALLGRQKTTTAFNVTIQLAYDGASTFTDTLTIALAAPAVGAPLQARSRVPRQRMEYVRFQITWPSSLIDEVQLNAIALEVAVKPGIFKLPATQSY